MKSLKDIKNLSEISINASRDSIEKYRKKRLYASPSIKEIGRISYVTQGKIDTPGGDIFLRTDS